MIVFIYETVYVCVSVCMHVGWRGFVEGNLPTRRYIGNKDVHVICVALGRECVSRVREINSPETVIE